MPQRFKDLPELITWLAERHHDGVFYAMSKKTGLSPATFDKWRSGRVKFPDLRSLWALADSYNLDRDEVVATAMRPLASRPRRGKTLLGFLLVAATTMGMVPLSSSASNDATGRSLAPDTAYYDALGRRRFYPWGSISRWNPLCRSGFPRPSFVSLTPCAA